MAKIQNINAEIEIAFSNEINIVEQAIQKANLLKSELRLTAAKYVREKYKLNTAFRRIGDVKNEYPQVAVHRVFYEKSNDYTLCVSFGNFSDGKDAHLQVGYLQDFLAKYEPIE